MMTQRPNTYHPPENQMMDDLGDAMTGGWWRRSKGLTNALINANAMMLKVFLRQRMGTNMFSIGQWFWAGAWVFVALLISQENWRHLVDAGTTEGHHFSGELLWWHGQVFVWLFLLKWAVAHFSLGSQNPRWFRSRDSVGESIIYPLVRWLLRPIGLIDDDQNPHSFWKINFRRWMLYWEPLLLFILAHQVNEAGYAAYGNFLTIATASLAYTTFQAAKNSDMEIQAVQETEHLRQRANPQRPQNDSPRRAIGD